jgi:hypothetical protein
MDLLCKLGLFSGHDLQSHHESSCFRQANVALLRSVGAHWARPRPFLRALDGPTFVSAKSGIARRLIEGSFASFSAEPPSQPWGWKDPRNSITLPVWLTVFPEARVVHVVRNGIDVALSVARRERRRVWRRRPEVERMVPPTFVRGYRLWHTYVEAALAQKDTAQHWHTLCYEKLLLQPRESLKELAIFVGLHANRTELGDASLAIRKRPTQRTLREQLWVSVLARLRVIDANLMNPLYERPSRKAS